MDTNISENKVHRSKNYI